MQGPVRRHRHAVPRRQYGGAMVEFAIVSVPLLLCGLALPDVARWQLARQAAHLALVEAARAGATEHGRPAAIQAAFERALLPLHADAGGRSAAAQRMRQSFERIRRATGLPPWRIEIQQPGPAAFRDFSQPGLAVPRAPGLPAIRNDYQAEQHARRTAAWPGGIGPASGLTIFQANTLRLRLVYLHEPALAFARALLRTLGNPQGDYARQAMARGGVLPVTLELEMDMQSHPVDWSSQPQAPMANVVAGGYPAGAAAQAGAAPDPQAPADPPAHPAQPGPADPQDPSEGGDEAAISPSDPACGVALCCIGAN